MAKIISFQTFADTGLIVEACSTKLEKQSSQRQTLEKSKDKLNLKNFNLSDVELIDIIYGESVLDLFEDK